MRKLGLIWRILIAIALAVIVGSALPLLSERFTVGFVRLMATFNDIFGGFLNFVVPLIILGFIAPGIAKLGKGSGKMLGIATLFAYTSTVFAGIMAYVVASNLLPKIMGNVDTSVVGEGRAPLEGLLELEIEPIMGVLTALVLAFLLGIGMAAIESQTMYYFFDELQKIVEKVITYAIIPLLPLHIFGIFLNLTHSGQAAKILSVFALVFVMIIILHLVLLTIQYTTAGAMSKKNPIQLMKTMAPAYFTALGTQSSAAAIPVTLQQARKTGASERVTNFTIPLFANIHLSGSTITIVSCSIGVLLLNGMDVNFALYLPFILMLGVTMIAAPGVPGGAVVAATGLLASMLGFSQEMVALMIALYMAQDSFGTATNVTGDGALAVMVDAVANKVTKSE